MFNAFHHFNDMEKKQIIEKMIATKRPFLFAEILQPFVKPFSLKRLLFTYFIPLNMITVLWDGIVSVIRAIPFSVLQQLAESVDSTSFEIKAVEHKTALAVITYLVGKPISEKQVTKSKNFHLD